MGSDNGHGHEHDTHYHGEPARVLDDRALPEAVVFYESGLAPQDNQNQVRIQETLNQWLDQLEDQGLVERAFVGSDRDVSAREGIDVHRLDETVLDPFREDFEGFPEGLVNEPGLLFLPAQLSVSGGSWSDLKANDVSVNWLSVVPDPKDAPDLPDVIVLSDWITQIDSGIPELRSTGVTPGVFQMKSDSLATFSEICQSYTSLEQGLQAFLDTEGEKIRPGFLRGREWGFAQDE